MVFVSALRVLPDGTEEEFWYEVAASASQHDVVNVDNGKVEIDGDHDSNAPIVIKRTLEDGHPYIQCTNDEGVQTFAVDGDGDVEVKGSLFMQPRADNTTGSIATTGLVSLQMNSALLYTPYGADGYPLGEDYEVRLGRAREIADSSHDQDGLKMRWGANRLSTRELLLNPLGQTPALRVDSARIGNTNFIELGDNYEDVFQVNHKGDIFSSQMTTLKAGVHVLDTTVGDLENRVTSLEAKGSDLDAEATPFVPQSHRSQKKKASAPSLDSLHATQQRLNNYIDVSQENIDTLQYDIEDLQDDVQSLDTVVGIVRGLTESNDTDIAANTTSITTNTTNVASNTSSIATNTTNIASNTTNIATNTTAIAALQSGGGSSSSTPSWYFKGDVSEIVYNANYTNASPYQIPLSSDMTSATGKPIHLSFNNSPSGSSTSQTYFRLPSNQSDLESLVPGVSYFRIINTNFGASLRSRIRVLPMTGSTGMGNTVDYTKPGESGATAHVRRILQTSSSTSLGTSRDVHVGQVADFLFYGSADIGASNTRYILWIVYYHYGL